MRRGEHDAGWRSRSRAAFTAHMQRCQHAGSTANNCSRRSRSTGWTYAGPTWRAATRIPAAATRACCCVGRCATRHVRYAPACGTCCYLVGRRGGCAWCSSRLTAPGLLSWFCQFSSQPPFSTLFSFLLCPATTASLCGTSSSLACCLPLSLKVLYLLLFSGLPVPPSI